jgi:hypothetical protein
MAKDLDLYLEAVGSRPGPIGEVTADIWRRFATADPGVDFARIHPFIEDGASP